MEGLPWRKGDERRAAAYGNGCPGLIKAVDEVLPESDKQRCTKHKTENVLDKVLEQDRASVK